MSFRPGQPALLVLLAAACAGLVSGCGSLDWLDSNSSDRPDLQQPAELEAHVSDLVQARLRAMFPEVEGDLNRASIERALAEVGSTSDRTATDGSGAAREQAVQALLRGDDETARLRLSEIAANREAQAARALRAAGDIEGALAGFARALDIAPHSSALRRERAETALDDGLARGDTLRLEAALADFQEATRRARGDNRDAARAWLGTSRAARALGLPEQALDAARRAFSSARRDEDLEGPSELAERTRAEAVLGALAVADSDSTRTGLASESRAALEMLASEARAALEMLIARAPDEVWAWSRLSEVLAAQGVPKRGSQVAATGLRIFPRNAELADALAGSTRALGGRDAVVELFAARAAADPTDVDAVWRPAQERYALALEALAQGSNDVTVEANLRESGQGFLRAGALAPARRDEANTAAARCLVGVGLTLQARQELSTARAAFLAAEARDPSVLSTPLAAGLPTGVEALRAVAKTLRTRGADPSRADATECLVEAAETYADLRRIAPGDADEAVLASSVQREAALALEASARIASERGRRDAAKSQMDSARGLMEAAYRSAVDAARAKPDDAVAVRTPGRLLVRFLQREGEVPQAETWLNRAAKLSEVEVERARTAAAQPGLDATQREERARRVEEAESRLGDVYQDLGVLHLHLKGDPHGAKAWFEKALSSGPEAREDVRGEGGWIARCDDAITNGTDPRLSPENRWGSLP